MRSFAQQEHDILDEYDGVSEIAVFVENESRQADIFPNLPLLSEQGILNIREYIRLDVLDRYNRKLPLEEKITQFTLRKDALSKQKNARENTSQLPKARSSREYALLVSFLHSLGRVQVLPGDHLDIDLALSSLEKVQLLVFLESIFGLRLSEQELIEHFSVESLAQYLSQKGKNFSEQPSEKIAPDVAAWSAILYDSDDVQLSESRSMHDLVLTLTGTFARYYFRLEAFGMEQIPESPVIIAANHQCFFDGFIMGRFLPRSFMKNSYVLAEEKHFNTPFRRFVARTSNVIIVNRNRDLKSALQKMAAVLERGSNLIIFPEGTRSKDGCLGPFKNTFAILSREFDVPIVPTVIQGGFEAMPSGCALPKYFKKIGLRFLTPIYPGSLSYADISDRVRQNIQEKLTALP